MREGDMRVDAPRVEEERCLAEPTPHLIDHRRAHFFLFLGACRRRNAEGPAGGHHYVGYNCLGHDYIGHNYVGHNYLGHNYLGHNYVGHNYLGHDYVDHSYIGHNYLDHNYEALTI